MNRNIFSSLILFFALFAASVNIFAQQRPRVVPSEEQTEVEETSDSNPVKLFPPSPVSSRPSLEKQIIVVGKTPQKKPEIKTEDSNLNDNLGNFSGNFNNQRLLQAIQSRIGIPYRYGSTGPNSFDCSGLVWSVFQDAGVFFERSSAGSYWQKFETVSENDKYKFGTLVFFNSLGHVGIVADDKGFYHASSSKGVTYSPFAGYWQKRIVGFRKIPNS